MNRINFSFVGYFVKKISNPMISFQKIQKRSMVSTHATPQYTGAEAIVRKYLPEQHHIVLANIACWFLIYGIYKLTRGESKPIKTEVQTAAIVTTTSGDIPSMMDDGFDEFISKPGNEELYIKSLEEWANNQK